MVPPSHHPTSPTTSSSSSSPPIAITVTPSSSAYFAGEPLTFHIRFRNTLPVPPSAQTPSRAHGHTRAVQSVSLGADAAPMTAPLPPKTWAAAGEERKRGAERLGLVGRRRARREEEGDGEGEEEARDEEREKPGLGAGLIGELGIGAPPARRGRPQRSHNPRSQSLSIAKGFGIEAALQTPPRGGAAGAGTDGKDAIPRTNGAERARVKSENFAGEDAPPVEPSPRARPVPSSHPHARKVSALYGPAPLSLLASPSPAPPTTPGPIPSPSPSPFPSIAPSPSLSPAPTLYTHANSTYSSSSLTSQLPPARHLALLPGHALLLWAFAHLSGSAEPSPALVDLSALRTATARGGRMSVGGGSLRTPGEHARSRSMWSLSGVAGWLGVGGAGAAGAAAGGKEGTLEAQRSEREGARTMNVWETRRTVLAVDLVLGPGEERTFTYTHPIPAHLPPTHRGKAIRIAYELVLGTNVQGGKSRVVKVPVRILPNVNMDGEQPVYDLGRPVVEFKDESCVETDEEQERGRFGGGGGMGAVAMKRSGSGIGRPGSDRQSLLNYASSLLAQHQSQHLSQRGGLTRSDSILSVTDRAAGAGDEQDCRAAVEVASRNSQKASYDIAKDGHVVAVLTLVKSAYRLGETVLGSVLINRPNSPAARVLKLSATLETHEEIVPQLSVQPARQTARATRRVHAEFHEAIALDLGRIGFALDVPSGEGAAFETSGVKLQWSVRLSFLVLSPPATLPTTPIFPPPTPRTPGAPLLSTGHLSLHPPTPLQPSSASPNPQGGVPNVYNEHASHLVPLETQEYTEYESVWRAVDRLGAGEGRGREEVVECEVPLRILPGSTEFRPQVVTFAA